MNAVAKAQFTIFCPVCATERERPLLSIPWGRITFTSLFTGLLLGIVAVLLIGWWWGFWSFILSAGLCFLACEIYYTLNFRRELICPMCRFDPALYRSSPDKAKNRCLENLKGKRDLVIGNINGLRQSEG